MATLPLIPIGQKKKWGCYRKRNEGVIFQGTAELLRGWCVASHPSSQPPSCSASFAAHQMMKWQHICDRSTISAISAYSCIAHFYCEAYIILKPAMTAEYAISDTYLRAALSYCSSWTFAIYDRIIIRLESSGTRRLFPSSTSAASTPLCGGQIGRSTPHTLRRLSRGGTRRSAKTTCKRHEHRDPSLCTTSNYGISRQERN